MVLLAIVRSGKHSTLGNLCKAVVVGRGLSSSKMISLAGKGLHVRRVLIESCIVLLFCVVRSVSALVAVSAGQNRSLSTRDVSERKSRCLGWTRNRRKGA